ncbi:helix-turn-helix domain-containing protein [Streptomyces formicae]|uniref:Helix-turn-helix transcriptional regulator n=1 Tax=Streptomyces formicae TaxID=1616117 RepID=A0ABY3WKW1_9ACTN|nr:helix-turn-helix transcriptional regulator [Streptomyces formicae]UNM13231.1 helix-turn-helix transcriptional regulator [Streptomyces formicae]
MQLRDTERFTELLYLKGLSQRKLADQAHVSQAFISMLARGRRGARPETAWRIASALGVYSHELFAVEPARLPRPASTATDAVALCKAPPLQSTAA